MTSSNDVPALAIRWGTQRPVIHYTFFYVVTVAGMILFYVGYRSLGFMAAVDLQGVVYVVEIFGAILVTVDTVCSFLATSNVFVSPGPEDLLPFKEPTRKHGNVQATELEDM